MGFISKLLHSQLFVTLPYPSTSLENQKIIITGANTGLGKEAAKHCVRLGADKVILAVRNLSKGDAANAEIKQAYPATNTIIEVWYLDLLNTASVMEFGNRAKDLERLDVVLANAGMITPVWREVEGVESTLLANVINTEDFALILLPKLQETAMRWNVAPRLSFVVSESHFVAQFKERKAQDILTALNERENANMDDR